MTANYGVIEKDGFKLKYAISGQGRPALIIGDAAYYPHVYSANLRNHLKLIFVDHKGFATPPDRSVSNSEFELEKIIDDIEYVRQQLKIDDFIIIGHSGHAYMALEYAKKYPEHVSHVVMLGITPNLGEEYKIACEEHWEKNASTDRKNKQAENERALPDEVLETLPIHQAFVKRYIRNAPKIWFDYNFDSTPFWQGSLLNMQMFNYVWGELFYKIDVTKNLENFDKPVFLGVGVYDFIAPYYLWTPAIESKFKDLTKIVFEKSGHTPQFEDSELFDKELLKWINAKS